MRYAYCLQIVFVIGKYTDLFERDNFVLGVGFRGESFRREVNYG